MDHKPSRLTQWLVWGSLTAVVLAIAAVFFTRHGLGGKALPVLKEVSDFELTNQFGRPAGLESFRGKVWLADIIFTRCAGPCARMTKLMSDLQTALPKVQMVSLTADPEFDNPQTLKFYGDRFGVDHDRWTFLTGPKQEIYNLATSGLLLAAMDNGESSASLDERFIHSTLFVLVDKRGRVRSAYETDQPGIYEKILADAQRLLRE